AQLNLFTAFREAGLLGVERGAVADWTAMPWVAGGSAAIVLKNPADAAVLAKVRELLDRLAADPANGIDRVLDADALRARGGFPTASFLVGLKPGWRMSTTPRGPLLSKSQGGTHGHLPDVPDLRAAFFLIGPGVPPGRALGLIERDPITTAKEVATLYRLSGGRVLFGIGGGWNAEEMEDHGTAWKSRWRLLRERVLAMKEIWTKKEPQFHGDFVNFDKIWADPKPVQKPHPPILIGGDGAT